MQHSALRRSIAGVSAILAGCMYTEPVNRQPKVFPPQRLCDAAHPADPCSRDNVHHGDRVMVKAVFSDPDGDVGLGTVQWRISACDGTTIGCDDNRLVDTMIPVLPPYPEFTVPSVRTGGGPVRNLLFELTVFDDRGASSTGEDTWDVIPDATAQDRSAETGTP